MLSGQGNNASYNVIAAHHNYSLVSYCRTSVSFLAGCIAGILGLTGNVTLNALFLGLSGFMFYFLSQGLLSFLLFQKGGKFWKKYFVHRSCLIYNGVFGELTTYILFWTFIYGMVHVY